MKIFSLLLLVFLAHFTSGQSVKVEEEFYPNGQLYSRGYYKKIRKDISAPYGVWTYWYENGIKMSEELATAKVTKFINFWTPDGAQLLSNGNGKLVQRDARRLDDSTVFIIRDSLKHGTYVSYVLVKGAHVKIATGRYEKGLLQGNDTTFYETGNIRAIQYYVDDEVNGNCFYYYENGNIKEQCNEKGYSRAGICSYYDSTGTLSKRITYRNGYESGDYWEYYPSGQMKVQGQYVVVAAPRKKKAIIKKPKKYGYGTSGYGEATHISVKDGIWMYYSEKGELTRTEEYLKGAKKKGNG